jgi:hypothetical protein
MKTKITVILFLAVAAIVILLRVQLKTQMPVKGESTTVTSLPVPPRIADAPPRVTLPTLTERERQADVVSLVGLMPFQSDASLIEMGATLPEQQVKLNALFEQTAMMIINSVVQNGKVTHDRGTRITATLPESTQKAIREHFYRGVEQIVGAEKLNAFIASEGIERVENELLGFGANAISIILEKRGDKIAVTFTTTHGKAVSEAYYVSQTLDPVVFATNFPELQAKL